MIQLLTTNRVVTTYQDSPVTDYYIKQKPAQFASGGSVLGTGPEGIGVRKNNPSLFNAIQTGKGSWYLSPTHPQVGTYERGAGVISGCKCVGNHNGVTRTVVQTKTGA